MGRAAGLDLRLPGGVHAWLCINPATCGPRLGCILPTHMRAFPAYRARRKQPHVGGLWERGPAVGAVLLHSLVRLWAMVLVKEWRAQRAWGCDS